MTALPDREGDLRDVDACSSCFLVCVIGGFDKHSALVVSARMAANQPSPNAAVLSWPRLPSSGTIP